MMRNLLSVFITVVSTVTSGVIVFIVGQILTTVWLHPLQKSSEICKKIIFTIVVTYWK